MIDKKLIKYMDKDTGTLALSVITKLLGSIINILLIILIANFISGLVLDNDFNMDLVLIYFLGLAFKFLLQKLDSYLAFKLAQNLKDNIRVDLLDKLFDMGISYRQTIDTAELVQLSVQGVENLESYFGYFIPQVLYSILSPLVLFLILRTYDPYIAGVLVLMVPVIPIAILLVQKLAKKVNTEHWGSFIDLSDMFLDYLEGLTTLKIYATDKRANQKINQASENFRIKTMKLLAVQLNNITLMDIGAYLGVGLGSIFTFARLGSQAIGIKEGIIFILGSSEFFLPLRLLGSFFHVAMNGMSSSDRLMEIINMKVKTNQKSQINQDKTEIIIRDLDFSYPQGQEVLRDINMEIRPKSLTAITGTSGCGKSTVLRLIQGSLKASQGTITIGGSDKLGDSTKIENISLVGNADHLFKASIRYNLSMGSKDISDQDMWHILDRLNLKEVLEKNQGLDTLVEERASNFSGGQRQRLVLARALLKGSPIYLFDEATSNIDTESEEKILEIIQELSKTKTVVFVSHQLSNVKGADRIYHMKDKKIIESGSFEDLIENRGEFYRIYQIQNELVNWRPQ